MSDLLILSGVGFIIFTCLAIMIGLAIYELRELWLDKRAPKVLKWLLTSFMVAFGAIMLGVAVKVMENL